MRQLILLLTILFLMSCGTKSTDQVADIVTTPKQSVETPKVNVAPEEEEKKEEKTKIRIDSKDMLGSYVGMFEADVYDDRKKPSWSNKINITIDKIEGEKVEGHSVVAGNNRPFAGTYKVLNWHMIEVVAAEPGDDRYDGVFTFKVYPNQKSIKGTWDANDKNQAVTKRKYDLEKASFEYKPQLVANFDFVELYDTWDEETGESEFLSSEHAKFNASVQELKKEDIENMHKGDLEVLRNSIYARHGYSFKNRRMRYIFNDVDWYIPYSTDIRDQLTDLEKKNIELIKRYEEHAEKFYDSFGR